MEASYQAHSKDCKLPLCQEGCCLLVAVHAANVLQLDQQFLAGPTMDFLMQERQADKMRRCIGNYR